MLRPAAYALLLLAFAACSAPLSLNDHWATRSWLSFEPSSERDAVTVECPDAATNVRTSLRADGASGELVLRLVDPVGVERHRQVVRSGRCEVVQSWPAQVGLWTLHVEPADYTGSYSIELSASDTPIELRVEVAGDRPK